ncbi:hypothetical protein M6B38_201165 [Iris pallida]|uniref:Uncharacterized protein n=1 Tax=Iris pallida TaxID=29817 RepID=A0AAX6E9F0_IRIPA|nr:hypothetical protein M6B38_201165 [Iris pallida]
MNPLFILFSWKMNSIFSNSCLVMLGTCRPKNLFFHSHVWLSFLKRCNLSLLYSQ